MTLKRTIVRMAAMMVVLTSAFTGCGGAGATGNPAKTAENFLHSLGSENVDEMCKVVAIDENPVAKGSTDWHYCQANLHEYIGDSTEGVGKYTEAKVETAQLDGDTAHVGADDISGVVEPDMSVDLVRVEGRWYVVV